MFHQSRSLRSMVRGVLGAVLLAGSLAGAAGSDPRPDPLAGIVAEALRANLSYAQERLVERRADAEAREARALLLPTVTAQSRVTRMNDVFDIGTLINPAYATLNQLTGTDRFPTDLSLTLPQAHESKLELVQPLFNETVRANDALARARRDGQRAATGAAARRLAANAQAAYLQQAAARREVEVYEATLALVSENQRVTERLLEAGRGLPEAVHRARAERAEVEQQLAEARERALAAARAFNQLLDRPLDAAIEVVPDSAFDFPLSLSADEAVAHALAAREELGQSDASVRATRSARRIANAAFIPSLAAVLDYGWQSRDLAFRPSQDYWTASLVLSWRLFDGGGDVARRSAAGFDRDRAVLARRELAERIALEVRTAHEAASVARAAIATADARREAARRSYTLVQRRFEEGAASTVELVDARTALTSAELNRVVTAYRYAIRWVDLERAAALRDLPSQKGAHS